MSNSNWRVDYVRYRNPDFADRYFAKDKADAERAAEGLGRLKHVSDVRISNTEESTDDQ